MILKSYELKEALNVAKLIVAFSSNKRVLMQIDGANVYIISEFAHLKCVSKISNLFPFYMKLSFWVNPFELEKLLPIQNHELNFFIDENTLFLSNNRVVSIQKATEITLPRKNYNWFRQKDKWGLLYQLREAYRIIENNKYSKYVFIYPKCLSSFKDKTEHIFPLPDELNMESYFVMKKEYLYILTESIKSNDCYFNLNNGTFYSDYHFHSFYISDHDISVPWFNKEIEHPLEAQIVGYKKMEINDEELDFDYNL